MPQGIRHWMSTRCPKMWGKEEANDGAACIAGNDTFPVNIYYIERTRYKITSRPDIYDPQHTTVILRLKSKYMLYLIVGHTLLNTNNVWIHMTDTKTRNIKYNISIYKQYVNVNSRCNQFGLRIPDIIQIGKYKCFRYIEATRYHILYVFLAQCVWLLQSHILPVKLLVVSDLNDWFMDHITIKGLHR